MTEETPRWRIIWTGLLLVLGVVLFIAGNRPLGAILTVVSAINLVWHAVRHRFDNRLSPGTSILLPMMAFGVVGTLVFLAWAITYLKDGNKVGLVCLGGSVLGVAFVISLIRDARRYKGPQG